MTKHHSRLVCSIIPHCKLYMEKDLLISFISSYLKLHSFPWYFSVFLLLHHRAPTGLLWYLMNQLTVFLWISVITKKATHMMNKFFLINSDLHLLIYRLSALILTPSLVFFNTIPEDNYCQHWLKLTAVLFKCFMLCRLYKLDNNDIQLVDLQHHC